MTNRSRSWIREIGLLIYPDCQLAAIHGLTDLFRIAGEWCEGKDPVRVVHWQAHPDREPSAVFDTHEGAPHAPDYQILPPSLVMPDTMQPMQREAEWLRRQHGRGSRICSVCAGAFVVAESGLLSGRRVTTHWAFADQLAARYPEIMVQQQNIVIDEGDILSAGGILAWADLGLTLVERIYGRAVMLATARFLVIQPPRSSQLPFATFLPDLDHGDGAILRVQHHIQSHLADPLRIEDLAECSGLGLRTFLRRFSKVTGHKPTEYIQESRMAKARGLLETSGKPIDQIAWAVGYQDASSFSKVFQRICGLSASDYRQRFGLQIGPDADLHRPNAPRRGLRSGG